MLKVDLVRLERQRRVRLDDVVAAEDPLWAGTEVRLARPLEVHLEAQQVGHDVVVRGQLTGEADLECRRCLAAVRVPIAEDVAVLYQAGVDAVEAERSEVYPLPARGKELDLSGMVREQVVLAVPAYAICAESCRGLCPMCGKNLNEGPCACTSEESDSRWGPLRGLKSD